jgi:hypothetical protein
VARRDGEHLILDIETVPDLARWTRPQQAPGVEAPFPPTWAHRVIVIGCMLLDSDYRIRRLGVVGEGKELGADPDERALLFELSKFVGKHRPLIVTYNGRGFDLPVIALRSMSHGVPLAWYYQERGVRHRYSGESHLDLCDWLADHGAARSVPLDAVARLVGLPGKVGVDGSQVEGLFRAGQLAAIQSYCLSDVVQTALLFLRFRLLQGQLGAAAYRDAATAMLETLAAEPRVAPVLAGIDRAQLLGVIDEP